MTKTTSVLMLMIAQVAAMSLWFVSAAVLPDMIKEVALSTGQKAALSSSVQVGFVLGAMVSAILGLADRFDPRRLFAGCAISAGICNGLLIVIAPDSVSAVVLRFATGALLAGVYPVGMKIAVGWGEKDRGFLVGLLVGALTVGSALPHLFSLAGGVDWRLTVLTASAAAICGGVLILPTALGPYHARAQRFNASVIIQAWTNKRVRYAYGGYFGHMWELYTMWVWIGVASAVSYQATLSSSDAIWLGKLTAFCAIAAGGLACAIAGKVADTIGKANVAIIAMVASGTAALATAASFGGPAWITFALVVIWGIFIIPDSAQFSALVADASPPEQAGSLMTFQTALGFSLTFFTVQAMPALADVFGWPVMLAVLAAGPIFGVWSMMRLKAIG